MEEYALIELGFLFQTTDTGLYVLDGRLTYVSELKAQSRDEAYIL